MAVNRSELRWNGWGRVRESVALSEPQQLAVVQALAQRLGVPQTTRRAPVAIADVDLPPSRLSRGILLELGEAIGPDLVRTSMIERAQHAAGRSLPDLLRLRSGKLGRAPDAVLYPENAQQIAAILRLAREHALSVVPFGGGSSVVGGVDPVCPQGKRAVLSLDTTRLHRLIAIDDQSLTATFEAGIDGPSLEAELNARGYTLGHFPQSFEHSTLGGWIAARSSGQQSDGYGGIDTLLVSAKLVTPRGELSTLGVPRTATGPDLKEFVLGSEGTLGVIVEATVRIRHRPAIHDVRGMLFRDFASGVRAIRALQASGLPMSMMRLSDARETELSLLLRRDPSRSFDLTAHVMQGVRGLGYGEGRCALLLSVEGDEAVRVEAEMLRAQAIGVRHGGLPLGKKPGESWKKDRFRAPYLRDFLLDHGFAIDTMETAFSWSKLEAGHDHVVHAMAEAARVHAGAGFSMGHISHSYADGACVYFIVLYPLAAEDVLGQWQAIKRATTDAIVKSGGTVSHHHGVGLDHVPWMAQEKGQLGLAAIRALRNAFDPEGMMNPGKLA
ncbi:MAG: FAD-binding oxidoreductase [Myxococcales bacterium]